MNFEKIINRFGQQKINLYIDMDGVIAEYDIGNFDYNHIRPLTTNIKILESINQKDNVNIFLLSISKTNQIVLDKLKWLEKNVNFLKKENIIIISKEEIPNTSSKRLKSIKLKNLYDKNKINIMVDDDNQVLKYLAQNNPEIIIFQDSSLID